MLDQKKPSEVLGDLSELLSKPYGWTKRRWHGVRGAPGYPGGYRETHCLVGGIERVACVDRREAQKGLAGQYLLQVVREQFPNRLPPRGPDSIITFNDHRDTRKKDVLLVIEKARILAEEKEELEDWNA